MRSRDLKGKRVAVTPGTEPYAFLLQALASANLAPSDITIVPLQHPLGRAALDRGDVDAWAGLDPFMAQAQLQNHDRLFLPQPGDHHAKRAGSCGRIMRSSSRS